MRPRLAQPAAPAPIARASAMTTAILLLRGLLRSTGFMLSTLSPRFERRRVCDDPRSRWALLSERAPNARASERRVVITSARLVGAPHGLRVQGCERAGG